MSPSPLRRLRVGDRVPTAALGPMPARRLAATAVVLPGAAPIERWWDEIARGADDLGAWDGRVHRAEADGEPTHRLLVVDRYRQVYAVHDEADADDLPDAAALGEWFRFLATACPECGVLDEPLLTGPTP